VVRVNRELDIIHLIREKLIIRQLVIELTTATQRARAKYDSKLSIGPGLKSDSSDDL
jgi:hypothetical protein